MTQPHMPAKGDKVEWKTPQGETMGTVMDIATKPIRIKSNMIRAAKDNPRVVVKSGKTGSVAAHKPSSVRAR